MPLTETFDEPYVKFDLETTLGGEGRDVELGERSFRVVIDKALRRFGLVFKARFFQIRERVTTSSLQTLQAFVLVLDSDVSDVSDVQFLNEQHLLFTQDVFAIDRYRRDWRGGTIDIMLTKMFNETYLRTRGATPEWEFDQATKKLHIYAPAGPYKVGITVMKMIRRVEDVPEDYRYLFLKIALRYAKEILARVRGKFGNTIPGTTGETSLDADALHSEWQTLETELAEELNRYRDNPGIVFG